MASEVVSWNFSPCHSLHPEQLRLVHSGVMVSPQNERRKGGLWLIQGKWWRLCYTPETNTILSVSYACVRAQLWPILCDPMDCSPPGPPVHGISQARILEQVVISYSRGSSRPRDRICVSCIGGWILYHWANWEAHWSTIQQHNIKAFFESSFFFFKKREGNEAREYGQDL